MAPAVGWEEEGERRERGESRLPEKAALMRGGGGGDDGRVRGQLCRTVSLNAREGAQAVRDEGCESSERRGAMQRAAANSN